MMNSNQKNILLVSTSIFLLLGFSCSSDKKGNEANRKYSTAIAQTLKVEKTVLSEAEERIFKKIAFNYRFECGIEKPMPFLYSKNLKKYWDKDQLLKAEMIFEPDQSNGLYFETFTEYKVTFDRRLVYYSYSTGGANRCEGTIVLSTQSEPIARVENNASNELAFWDCSRKVFESLVEDKSKISESTMEKEDFIGSWKGMFDDKVALTLVIESVNGKKIKAYTKIGKNTQSFIYEGEINDIGDGFKSLKLSEQAGKGRFNLQNTPEKNLEGTWTSGSTSKKVVLKQE